MSEQATLKIAADLRSLLADPALAAALPVRRMGSQTFRLFVAATDAVLLVALAFVARSFFPETAAALSATTTGGVAVMAAAVAAAVRCALHTARMPEPAGAAALRAAGATAAALATMGLACWLVLSQDGEPPGDFLLWLGSWFLASAAAAVALRHAAHRFGHAVAGSRRVVVVGAPDETEQLVRAIAEAPRACWRFEGCMDDRETGGLDRLRAMVVDGGADIVALAVMGRDATARIAAICKRLSDQRASVCLAFDTASLVCVPRSSASIGRFALLDLITDPQGGLSGTAKRAMDLVVSAAALLALLPALVLAALAIRLESPGPVLFQQWRFGLGSRPILIYKFRTMRAESCDATGERRTTARDMRVTRVGRVLRRTSIDELPQLINVLRGDMSLVGPRPHPLHMRVDDAYYFEAVETYRARHLVKPGITGWAQVNGSRGEVDTIEKARRRVALDLWYLNNWSLMLDLHIMLRTACGAFATLRSD
ncbi:hypothetical protein GCM10009416_41310 [Craurococcus roseus]|uniref:Bacterial sugar transferase domain-containing protein n=1 Tax=Craurococcus roseus TaxID=77585 RepID=A0ABN1FW00_9PROT